MQKKSGKKKAPKKAQKKVLQKRLDVSEPLAAAAYQELRVPEPDEGVPVPASVPRPKGHFEHFNFANSSVRDVDDLTYQLYDRTMVPCPPSPNIPAFVPQHQVFTDLVGQPYDAIRIVLHGRILGDPLPQFHCDYVIADPQNWSILRVEAGLTSDTVGNCEPHCTLVLENVNLGTIVYEPIPPWHWQRW